MSKQLDGCMGKNPGQLLKTMCPMNCHPTVCGIHVHTEKGKISKITGDVDHPESQGFLCARGKAIADLPDNSRRLTQPLRRAGPRGSGQWEPITWAAALDQIAEASRLVGRERTAIWTGGGSMLNVIGRQLSARFGNLYGCQHWDRSVVCWALGAYGLSFTGILEVNSHEDMAEHSKTILLWGSDVSSQPGTAAWLSRARRNGSKIISIDVRRGTSAKQADESHLVRPGSDSALALAMMRVIVEENLIDQDFVASYTIGYAELVRSLEQWTPEYASDIVGMTPGTIRTLAREYATAKPAMILIGGGSIHKYKGGWLATRNISCLPALTGNLGKPGAGIGPRHRANLRGDRFADITALDRKPAGTYIPNHMESIARAVGEGKVGVLLMLGTNMLSSFADSSTLEQGMDKVNLLVTMDLFSHETTRLKADLVLPGTCWLEEIGIKDTQSHIYLMDKVREAPGECRAVSWVLDKLATRLGIIDYFPWKNQEGAVDAMLAGFDQDRLSVARLRSEGGHYAREAYPVAYVNHRYHTPSGKVEFFSERALSLGLPPLPIYQEPEETPRAQPDKARNYPLIFRQGRTITSFNAWFDEGRALPDLVKAEPFPLLWIHPEDASARAIQSGDTIEMYNERGTFLVRSRVTTDIQPGVVWMRAGWAGINRLTSCTASMSPEAAMAIPGIPGGQAAYEAMVQLRAAPIDKGEKAEVAISRF
ncbi:MAG: molybdopterin-dependent oxidoreductase [Planctomycetota bacterium]|nr:molybdopterin-dependent oxidoreductase [Planctomycetota bacterium]